MDTDGSINKKGRCEITFKSKTLILGLSELLSSLGIKHTVEERTAFVTIRRQKQHHKFGGFRF